MQAQIPYYIKTSIKWLKAPNAPPKAVRKDRNTSAAILNTQPARNAQTQNARTAKEAEM